ncbi:unnamed protein product [Closterium sp. Naga37s-1]|nr:unnamed protein product [Closterium sp. Naga37s-1]
MGTIRPRFLLALVLVASLNFLAVFAALPPDRYYDASEPAGLEEAHDARALLEAESEAAFDAVDWVESDNSEDPRILADVAADLKQSSDDLSGAVKKSLGQAGRNVRNSIGSMIGVPTNKGKKKHQHRGGKKHQHRGGKKHQHRGGKKHHHRPTGPAGAGKRRSSGAAPKTSAAPAAGAPGLPKKQAGAKDTSGAAPKPLAAPASANDPRALLEAADSDAALFESVDSVDFEDPRVLRTIEDVAADVKQSSDDFSGAVKNSIGRMGTNMRNSFERMTRPGRFDGVTKPRTKPGVQSFTKPVTKPGSKPVTKPGVKPGLKPVTKPGVQPFKERFRWPGVLPGSKPVTKAGV